ncbi:MAG: adenylate/guanylate cyclase domain-containing protein [Saprospiraceae bacterium]
MEDEVKITAAIAALEAQRSLLGDAAVNAAIAALQAQLDSARARAGISLDLSGERKLVTVMFADISGFTALSETMDPEQVRALMNGCFDYLVPVIQAHEGTIDKFIGDEIMALFGAPIAHERHAELACAAGLEMFRALEDFNRKHQTTLELHIGINSGLVIAGAIGSQGRQDYSIMGDAVNLAARLKDAATRGEIFVGEEVFALAKDFFHFQPMPPMRLKGKQELVRSWKLLRPKDRHNLRRERTVHAGLIGREEEVAAIVGALSGPGQASGCRVWIIGEAGIGKSRLLEEVKGHVGQKVRWAEGAALASSRQNAYQPAAEILARLISPGQRLEPGQLKVLLKQHFMAYGEAIGMVHFAALCRTMQISLDDEEEVPLRYLKGNELREKVSAAFSAFLTDQAKEKPVVLVWDDLHWADPSSLALIEDLLLDYPTAPVSCILALRPQKEEKAWELYQKMTSGPNTNVLNLSLGQLDRSQCASLARKLLNAANIAPEVEAFLLEKAEGNPFFLEELLRSLLDSEILYVEGKTVKSTAKLDTIGIPRTLQGVIASRIDRLQESDKQVLQIASVLGRIFRDIVLAELLLAVKKKPLLDPSLQRLVERELLRLDAQDFSELSAYIFRHAVTHDVAYNSLLQADRKILHQMAGETLGQLFGADQEAYAERIGFHFEMAGDAEKALHFLQMAAQRAQNLHFNEEAIALYDRAAHQAAQLAAAPGNDGKWNVMRAAIYESKGDILRLMAQGEPAAASYQDALAQIPATDQIGIARLHRKTALCYQGLSRVMEMVAFLQKAQDILETMPGERNPVWWTEWIEVLNERMLLHYWTNETELMQVFADKIAPSLGAFAAPVQQAKYYGNLAALHIRLGEYLLDDTAAGFASRSVDAAVASGNLLVESSSWFNLGFSKLWKNDMPGAIPCFQRSLELAEKTGDMVAQSRNLTYLMVAYRRLGDVANTDLFARKSLEIAQKINMPEYQGMANANFAWLAYREKRWSDVEAYAQQAFAYWEKLTVKGSSLVFVWLAVFPLTAALAQRNDYENSRKYLAMLSAPGRKRLEPELVDSISSFLVTSSDVPQSEQQQQINGILRQAGELSYL